MGLITAGALALRLTQLDQSLFGDEVYTYHDIAGRSFFGMGRAIHPPEENAPPLFFVLAWLSAKLGDPTVLIRLPSLILSTATIPIAYLLGRETVGRAAGLIAAALLAVTPFTLYYSIEARPYAAVAFFVSLAAYAVLKAARTQSLRWWVLYVIAAAAAAYSHYTGIFALVVLAAWSLWACRERPATPAIAAIAIVALYTPWIPHLGSQDLAIIGALEPLTLHNIAVDSARVLAGYPYAGLATIPTVAGLIAIAACLLVGVVALTRGGLAPGDRGRIALVLALALATPLGVLLYSVASTDIWDPRDLYASAPAAALVLGALLAAIPRPVRIPAIVLVLAILLAGAVRAIGPRYARPEFRAAAAYLDGVAGPQDPVIMYPSLLGLDSAIPVQFKRPHRLLRSVPARWPTPPPGGADYAILDDSAARALRIGTPRPYGFELVARRHYPGLVAFSLLTYRPSGA